jgi:ferritin-like metal-binding protein YciE
MSLHSLKDLFVHELQDLYDAEEQLLRALPRFAAVVRNDELRLALEEHVAVTRKHITRLDRIFESLGIDPAGVPCNGMKGLLKEGDRMLEADAEEAVRDAGLLAAVQRIEHYEIAAYGAARLFADSLGYEDFAWALTETWEDEREADQRLRSLAESAVNLEAAEAPEVGR